MQVHKGMGVSLLTWHCLSVVSVSWVGNILLAGWCFSSPIITFMFCRQWTLMSSKRMSLCTSNITPPGSSLRYLIFSQFSLTCRNETKDKKSVSDRHWVSGEKVWCPQADVETNAFKRNEPWEMSVGYELSRSQEVAGQQTVTTLQSTRSAKNLHAGNTIFNIAIAFLFSFIRYATAGAPFQEFCLNAFLSYFFFLNLDATWYFQKANVLLLFKEKPGGRPGHLSGWTMLDWCREQGHKGWDA